MSLALLDLVLAGALVALAFAFVVSRFRPQKPRPQDSPVELGDSLSRAVDKVRSKRQ